MTKGCPHRLVQFCPLYVACHMSILGKYGCDDGQMGYGGCASARKLNYETTVARLEAEWPAFVEDLREREEAAKADEQRRRNMRLLGYH